MKATQLENRKKQNRLLNRPESIITSKQQLANQSQTDSTLGSSNIHSAIMIEMRSSAQIEGSSAKMSSKLRKVTSIA